MEMSIMGATGEQVETGQKAGEEGSGEDEETGGKTEGGGITVGLHRVPFVTRCDRGCLMFTGLY